MIRSLAALYFMILPLSSFGLDLVEKTVAIVNNEPILLSDLKQLEGRLSKSGMIDDLLLFDSTPDSLKKNTSAQLQFLINERIIDSEVKRQNLTVTMDRVDQEIREIAKRNGINKESLINTLQSQGINIADYQDFMKQRIERQSVVEQEITSKIRLSDEDVLAFYTNESGKRFKKINEYTLAHIFFSPVKGGEQEALARAERTLALLREGTSFDKLLSKTTEEEGASPNGLLGTFKSGEFSEDMEKAVRDLNVGDFSKIVKSRTGYHIIKLLAKKLVTDPEFEKSKDKYRGLLFEKVFKRQFKAWLDLKRDEASIKMN
jgi:peptidyl-prolyl cis-trans isomerase SurA